MKKFNIVINGDSYEVGIEEVEGSSATTRLTSASRPAPVKAAPMKAAASAPAPADPTPAAAGATVLKAPMPGKIVKLIAAPGQAVKKGDVILILEAMKMQNEISAPVDGTVASISAVAGQSVKPGEALAVIS